MTEPTTIADAITAAQGRVADCYTAISAKGGTLPATQNLANMPTAINSISGGGSGYSEFPSYQVYSGTASQRSATLTGNEFSSISTIDDYAFYYTFYENTELTGAVSFPNLITVSGNKGLFNAFGACTGLTSVDLSSLTTVSGSQALQNTFAGCTGITSIDLSSLTTIGSQGLYSAFYGCTGITAVDLSALTTVGSSGLGNAFKNCYYLTSVDLSDLASVGSDGLSNAFYGCFRIVSVSFTSLTTIGSSGFYNAFCGCSGLTDIYFNGLTTTSFGYSTNQFLGMLSNTGSSVTHTLHFPANLQTIISGLSGYPNFGGTSGYVTLAFDLPATQQSGNTGK